MAKKVDKAHISEQEVKTCLVAIMSALGDEDHSYYSDLDISITTGSNRVKIKSKIIVTVPKGTRESVAKELRKKILDDYRVEFTRGYKDISVYLSLFEEDQSRVLIKLKEEKVDKSYNKPSGENKGSGGGSTQTAIVESAQCLYCDLAFNVYGAKIDMDQLIDKSDLDKAYKNIEVDVDLDDMLSIAPAWKKSSILGANKLYDTLKKGPYKFYRSEGIDAEINKAYKLIKGDSVQNKALSIQQKVPQSEDKWNPADIWAASTNFSSSDITKNASSGLVKNLNSFLIEKFESQELVGVSLKKITGSADIVEMNNTEDRHIDGAGFGGADFNYDTLDTYIDFKSGNKRIQFRNFDSSGASWQGEVEQKGSSAKHGKIGGGAIWAVLNAHGVSYHSFAKNNSQLYKDCGGGNDATRIIAEEIYSKLSGKVPAADRKMSSNKTQEVDDIISNGQRWMYTKFLGLTLIDAIGSATNSDELVKDIYLYASSQHSMSGVYYKLT